MVLEVLLLRHPWPRQGLLLLAFVTLVVVPLVTLVVMVAHYLVTLIV